MSNNLNGGVVDVEEAIKEVLDCLKEDERFESDRETLVQYGAYINWLCPHISIDNALSACIMDDDAWNGLILWLKNPSRPLAGCAK